MRAPKGPGKAGRYAKMADAEIVQADMSDEDDYDEHNLEDASYLKNNDGHNDLFFDDVVERSMSMHTSEPGQRCACVRMHDENTDEEGPGEAQASAVPDLKLPCPTPLPTAQELRVHAAMD